MNTKVVKIVLFVLLFSFIFWGYTSQFTHAGIRDDGPRYLVKSQSGFWKNALGVRHEFDESFTADLSGFQLTFARLFGLELEPVELLHILPPITQIELDLKYHQSANGSNKKRIVPSDQTPWGVEVAYNNATVKFTSGGQDVDIAVLDTGILKKHPDLKNRIAQCKDFTNMRFVVVNGKCDDKNGHGTHISGTISADGGVDDLGIFGIAPESNIFAYKVCGADGSCWVDDIAFAIRHAADNGAEIINLSLGANSDISILLDAVNYAASKGVLLVAAGGNDGPYFDSIDYPAAYLPVIGVGAIDVALEVPDWSSRGINSTSELYTVNVKDMEFGAPGVNIESAWKNGGYAILSGTSMAAPHISGLAALLWQGSAETTRDHLQFLANDIWEAGDDDATGFGLLQLPLSIVEESVVDTASESLIIFEQPDEDIETLLETPTE